MCCWVLDCELFFVRRGRWDIDGWDVDGWGGVTGMQYMLASSRDYV